MCLLLVAVLDVAHFWRVVTAPAGAPSRPVAATLWSQLRGDKLPVIVAAHLFGRSLVSGGGMADSPEATLGLTLSGVFARADPGAGDAILGEKGKPARLYHAGADLSAAQAVRLQQVFSDRVILQVAGQLETLRLPRQGRPVAARVAQVSLRESGDGSADATPAGATSSFAVPNARDVWLSNLHVDSSSPTGMVVYPEKRVQRSYGLHPGDTLTAINGIPVTNQDALASAMKNASGPISMTFMHDGAPVTVDVPQDGSANN